MPKNWLLGAIVALGLAVPSLVHAHEGHAHKVMGTIAARQDQNVQLKTPEGKVVTVVLNDKTTFARGKQKVDSSAVKVGQRVVVEVAGEKDMTAKTVTLPAAAPATAKK
jgi:hypothetical protein